MGFSIRVHCGGLILAGAGHIDASSPLLAELSAACWALQQLVALAWPGEILLEGDSALVISWLGGAAGSIHPSLLSARKSWATLGRRASLAVVPANSLADSLACYGKCLPANEVWSKDCLPDLGLASRLLLPPEDLVQKSNPKKVRDHRDRTGARQQR